MIVIPYSRAQSSPKASEAENTETKEEEEEEAAPPKAEGDKEAAAPPDPVCDGPPPTSAGRCRQGKRSVWAGHASRSWRSRASSHCGAGEGAGGERGCSSEGGGLAP